MSNKNSITYRQVGDYRIPNFTLPPEETNIHLRKWGMLHKDYLLKHKQAIFTTLLTEGKLWQYLVNIDRQATKMYEFLIEQMKVSEGFTELLKEKNQMEWVRRIDNIQQRASDIVCNILVYT